MSILKIYLSDMDTPESFDANAQSEMVSAPGPERLHDAESIEDELFDIHSISDMNEDVCADVRERLDEIGKSLSALEVTYPNDLDLKELRLLYGDLRRDFESGQELQLDESFDQLIALMEEEISKSGVRTELVDETILNDTILKLRGVGIHPSYVVTQGDPNAKTIVFFMQLHSNPGMDKEFRDSVGITASQREIYEGIRGAQKAGLGKTVYAEGLDLDMSLDLDEYLDFLMEDENNAAMANLQLEHDLGDRIDTVGAEETALFFDMFTHPGRGFEYRCTAHNIFIADNVADHFSNSDETLAFLSFGAFHETADGSGEEESPLPLSQILAYRGFNVVVVDAATRHFDLAVAEKWREDRLAALRDKEKP